MDGNNEIIKDMQSTTWPWLVETIKTLNFTEQKDLLTPFFAVRDSALLLRDTRIQPLNKSNGNSAFTDDIRRIIDDEQRIVDKPISGDNNQLHMYLRHILPFSFSFPPEVPDSEIQMNKDDDWLDSTMMAGCDDDNDENDYNNDDNNSKERSPTNRIIEGEVDYTDEITDINAKANAKATSSRRVHRSRVLPAFLDLSDDDDDDDDDEEDDKDEDIESRKNRNRISSDTMAAAVKKRMQRSKVAPTAVRPPAPRPLAAVRQPNPKKGHAHHVMPSSAMDDHGKHTRQRALPAPVDNNAAEKVLLHLPLIRARKASTTCGVMSKNSANIVRQSLLKDDSVIGGGPDASNSDAFRVLWKSQAGEMAFVPKVSIRSLQSVVNVKCICTIRHQISVILFSLGSSCGFVLARYNEQQWGDEGSEFGTGYGVGSQSPIKRDSSR